MKYTLSIATILILSLIMTSCNKNSNQLPPVILNSVTIPFPATGLQVVSILLSETQNIYAPQISAQVTNNSSDTLYGIYLMVEICPNLPQSAANCNSLTFHLPDTLPPNTSSKIITVTTLSGQSVSMDQAHINAGLINYYVNRNSTHKYFASPYSGFYQSGSINHFPYSANSQYQRSVYGYVLADGTATFRSAQDSVNNITGNFVCVPLDTTFLGNAYIGMAMYPLRLIPAKNNLYIDSTSSQWTWLWTITNGTLLYGSDSLQITASRQ